MAVRRLAEVQPQSFAFSPDNHVWAERQIARFPEGRQASAVISLLWRAQEQEGWVTKPAIEGVATMLAMPYIRVLEVATFYTMFQLEPVGTKAHVQVCGTTPCMLRGAGEIIDVCRSRIHHDPHHLSADGAFSWEEVECLGSCVNAPMIQVFKDTYEDLTPATFNALLDAFDRGENPQPGPQNGRQYAMPITGATTLTEIAYSDDDVRPARVSEKRGTSQQSVADSAPPSAPASGERSGGGEVLGREQARRTGEPEPRAAGGRAPDAPETANQEAGRVDPAGRSDEAAARSHAGQGRAEQPDTSRSGEKNPDHASHADSPDASRKG